MFLCNVKDFIIKLVLYHLLNSSVKVLKEDKRTETAPNELGEIAVQLPLPPGSFSTLWKDDGRFQKVYFEKLPVRNDKSSSPSFQAHLIQDFGKGGSG